MHVEYVCSVTLFKDLSIKRKELYKYISRSNYEKCIRIYAIYFLFQTNTKKTKRKTKISGRHEIPLCYYISCSIEQR